MVRRLFLLNVCVFLITAGVASRTVTSPIQPAGLRVVLSRLPKNWQVMSCEWKPTVKLRGVLGYRILLEETHDFSTAEVAAFPAKAGLRGKAGFAVSWMEGKSSQPATAEYWGRADGFEWFGEAARYWQYDLCKALGLKGNDPADALIAGLTPSVDQHTYLECRQRLLGIGQSAIPRLVAAIEKDCSADPKWRDHHQDWPRVWALSMVASRSPLQVVRSLYASRNAAVAQTAADSLLIVPYRVAAKDLYLDMLRRNVSAGSVAEICMGFRWRDAQPLVSKALQKPQSWEDFRLLYSAERALQGKPTPKQLLLDCLEYQELRMWRHFELWELRAGHLGCLEVFNDWTHRVATSSDKEAAAVVATQLVLDDEGLLSEAGWAILRQMPESKDLLRHFSDLLPPESPDRDRLGKIVAGLEDGAKH